MNNKPFCITVARDGETTDGRNIPAQLILSLANTYDRKIYSAQLWTEGSTRADQLLLGEIEATKTEARDGVTWLLALIQPNSSFHSMFLNLNNRYQNPLLLYPGLEYFPEGISEFGGKPYISGISAVIKPAFIDLKPLNDHAVKNEPPIYRSI